MWEKALEYGRRAGEQAQALYAPQAAIEQLTRALQAAQHCSLPPSARLYRARGLSYETLGAFESARADHEIALRMTHLAEDRHGEWQSLMDIGFLWAGRDYAQAGAYFQRALALARTVNDPAALAHSLNRLGSCWALILVMFGLGVGSLVWMAVLAGVMVVEKTFPGGQRLRPVIGIVLLLLAVLWFVHPTWLLSSVGGV